MKWSNSASVFPLLGKDKIVAALLASTFILGPLVSPTPAAARSVVERIIEEVCGEERLRNRYSARDLMRARDNLPSDEEEYRDARSILDRAIAESLKRERATGGRGRGQDVHGGSAGQDTGARQAAESPAEKQAVRESAKELAKPIKVGDAVITPGASTSDSPRRNLPVTVAFLLATLGACIVAGFVPVTRRLVKNFISSKRLKKT